MLENLFTGFVSNNFDLNYVLYSLILVGMVSLFGNFQKEIIFEPKINSTISDYILIIIFAFFGSILIFFKVDLIFFWRLVICFVSGILIFLISLVTISDSSNSLKTKLQFADNFKKIIAHWSVLSLIVMFLFIAIFCLFKKRALHPNPKINISIVNCSYNEEISVSLVKSLIKKGYPNTVLTQSDKHDCKDVIVLFASGDKDQANLIIKNLEPFYLIIQKAPPQETIPRKITIILGNNYF